MKKRATTAAPMPVFSAFKFDSFTQKYVSINEKNVVLGSEIYLNPPIRQQIITNGAKPDLVIAKQLNDIITGLRRVLNCWYVGNVPIFKGANKLTIIVASCVKMDGNDYLCLWYFKDYYPSVSQNFKTENDFVKRQETFLKESCTSYFQTLKN
jgi:hypothetical protein